MSAEQLIAIGGIISAVGVPLVAMMTLWQNRILKKVERQGNSVALEGKRTTAVALRLLATSTGKPEDEVRASDAEKVYQEAKNMLEESKAK